MSESMRPEPWDILWHSLGMQASNYRRRLAWWLDNDKHRNHFAAAPGYADERLCVTLVGLGYMLRGREIPGGLVYYHVTGEGIAAARTEYAAHRKRKALKGTGPA